MALPLPSTGQLSIGDIHNHCTDSAPIGQTALHATIVAAKWTDVLTATGSVTNWDSVDGKLEMHASITLYTYHNTVDTDLGVAIAYQFYDGMFGVQNLNTNVVIAQGYNSGFDYDYPACYGSCYIYDTGNAYDLSTYSTGNTGPADNINWYHGKLRYTDYMV